MIQCNEQKISVNWKQHGNNYLLHEEQFTTSELELDSDNKEENIINKRPEKKERDYCWHPKDWCRGSISKLRLMEQFEKK